MNAYLYGAPDGDANDAPENEAKDAAETKPEGFVIFAHGLGSNHEEYLPEIL